MNFNTRIELYEKVVSFCISLLKSEDIVETKSITINFMDQMNIFPEDCPIGLASKKSDI